MQYRVFGRTKWRVSEIGYGMWGMAGWTGSDDEESRQSLDRAVALGLQFLRHRLGVRRRQEREAARRAAEAAPGQAASRRDQDSAEEPPVARAAAVSRSTMCFPRTTSANTPRSACAISASTRSISSSSMSGRTNGRKTTAGRRLSTSLKDGRADSRVRHQHQPLAARERA